MGSPDSDLLWDRRASGPLWASLGLSGITRRIAGLIAGLIAGPIPLSRVSGGAAAAEALGDQRVS